MWNGWGKARWIRWLDEMRGEMMRRPWLSSSAKAGDPVRRGLSVLSSAPLEYWVARSSRAMTLNMSWRSRDALRPSFARNFPPSNTEGAGKTGCALHPRSRVRFALSRLHTSIQGSGEHPTFPAQWLYGLCRDLPGDEFLVDSVAAVRLSPTRQLDTCNGRQDHTVLPYAHPRHRLSVNKRPPQPAQRP